MEEVSEGGPVVERGFDLFELNEDNGKRHSALRVPRTLPSQYATEKGLVTDDIFNIFMGDVSGSMCSYWRYVVQGWQENIQNKLTGTTSMHVFGSEVTFIRNGPELCDTDNLGGGTDLTSALKTVREEVEKCSQSNVRIFIVTDGGHGYGEPQPETEISKMMAPAGKTVSVYLLGIGHGFPVNYSIDMRSQMHNGNSNIPALFWAKDSQEIVEQMMTIGEELDSGLVKLKLNLEGYVLPGLEKTSSVHLGEWLYFDQPPEELPSMSVSVNDEPMQSISTEKQPGTMRHLLDSVFRQWNSVLIQQHRKKAHVPRETFSLMESLFNYHLDLLKKVSPTGQNIKSRLARKNLKGCEIEYQTLVNQSKTVIDIEGKFQNEMELAETILKSTVTNRKFDVKNLKLKGHGQEEYENDLVAFKKSYSASKDKIKALPRPTPDECCNVTITSTLNDLQDPDFPLMFEETKFDLLKSFTMSGIPIYAPVRDASQINPWTLVIKHILVTPFTILSQQVLELSASANLANLGVEDKDVVLQQDNEKTRFNAIIPIVPASASEVLKPIVLSNIYAMMSTFCILKNPHIIDYNAHLAALGCAWIRTVREFPITSRPEFASDRLASIVATANLYMGRPSITRYMDALVNNPKQALMTESVDEFDGKNLKCESLIKPAFFMHLKKDKFSMQQVTSLLEHMLFEFLGRCLTNYKADDAAASPYTDFFCSQLSDQEERKIWLAKHCKSIIDAYQASISQGNLLESFFTLDDLIPGLKEFVSQKIAGLTEKIEEEVKIAVDMKRVARLRNFGSCGDIMWKSFQTWAQEMGIPQEKIDETFSPNTVLAYVHAALQGGSSKERMSGDLPSSDGVLEIVKKRVLQENTRTLRGTILKEVEEYAVKQWRDAYMQAHRPLVMPMTRQQVVEAAQTRKVPVTLENFSSVYRYSAGVGLVRNACQIPGCPHYLQPHNNFNQHISVEREQGNFPHALHLVSLDFCGQGIDGVIKEVVSGKHAGTKKRKVPPPPEADVLQPLTDELKSLVIHYSKGIQTCTMEESQPEQPNEDDDQFFDCDT